jgi:hypothetical protein
VVKRQLLALACVLCAAGCFASVAAADHGEKAVGQCPAQNMVSAGPITVSGGRAAVQFTVAQGCSVELSLVSYKASSPTFDEQSASQQQVYDKVNMTLPAGSYTWSVAVPDCYYQVDFVYGKPIDHLGTQGFYGSRRIEAVNGGTKSCTSSTPPNNTTPPNNAPPNNTAPIQRTAPMAPAPPASITLVKLERVGTTGDFVAGPVTAKVGDTIYYQITVTNTGPAASVNISDPGCTGLAPAGPQGLETGKSVTFTCSHALVAADGSSYTNTVTATATAASGVPATATASVTATVGVGAVLGVTKTIKHAGPARKHKVKKVTKQAKPARARVRAAGVTG